MHVSWPDPASTDGRPASSEEVEVALDHFSHGLDRGATSEFPAVLLEAKGERAGCSGDGAIR